MIVQHVSGVGTVALGIQWPDQTVALHWLGPRSSTVVWDSVESIEVTHGHGGSTTIRWIDA